MKLVELRKTALRRQTIVWRWDIPPREKLAASHTICETLLHRPEVQYAKVICTYASLPEEVDSLEVLQKLIEQKNFVVVPRVSGDDLILHRIHTMNDLVPGRFDIMEPKLSCPVVDPTSVDLFIVPGIAFDRKGYRLGWGKGYYDRLLAGVKATKIGLAYSFQIVSRLNREKYDIPMDIVITEHETLTP